MNNIVDFFNEFEFGDLEPIECELTYINHIPKGEGWNTIDDFPGIFSDFVWNYKDGRFLPKPQKVAWHAEFLLPEDKGHLFISLKHAIRTEGQVPLLVLELKTIGIDKTAREEGIREWFDLAHEWIVRGFTDSTTPEIQKIWEREENA
jgi:uncharacterized protein (TIGR04255 family)